MVKLHRSGMANTRLRQPRGAYAHWYYTVGGLLSKATEHFLLLLQRQGLEIESTQGIPGRSQFVDLH